MAPPAVKKQKMRMVEDDDDVKILSVGMPSSASKAENAMESWICFVYFK